jgi:hypothetical protein
MNKIEWNELCDEKVENEKEILSVEYNATNEAEKKIRSLYLHGTTEEGVKITIFETNESDGTSAAPPYFCVGHLTPAECLAGEVAYVEKNGYINDRLGK